MTWTRDITRDQWRTLFAAQLGWMLDAMDVMLYSFALTAVRAEFQRAWRHALRVAQRPVRAGALSLVVDPCIQCV